MLIRKSTPADIPALEAIYDAARKFMRRCGNMQQWSDGYPSAESALRDIDQGCSYVCVDDTGRVAGTFFFKIGADPTYSRIYQGSWLNDGPYGVIHRIASDGSIKGMMAKVLDWCAPQVANLRIDTHRDNAVMRRNLAGYGFEYCGIIYLANGDERLAFQYVAAK